jgi:hypothetical protein
MGVAQEVFRWDSIGKDGPVGVFIHPYGKNEFVAFGINVTLYANEPSGAYTSIAAQLTDGPTNEFFGDIARTLWVQNQAIGPQPFISVGLVRFRQETI